MRESAPGRQNRLRVNQDGAKKNGAATELRPCLTFFAVVILRTK